MMYIRATTCISPQPSFTDAAFPPQVRHYQGNRLQCISADYKAFIDAKVMRRMSRVIRMGVAAANKCLADADLTMPDGIVVGTAYGCLEDTGVFLRNMIERGEEQLTPTAFIQSTHNTIGAQIALLLQCRAYNNTFVNGGSSFESALLDAQMMLAEGAQQVLAGGVDELTDDSFAILKRFGLYKNEDASTADLYAGSAKGTLAGEGAAFFVLSAQATGHDVARLDAISTLYKPASDDAVGDWINNFLSAQGLKTGDVDLVMLGRNGDTANDAVYNWADSDVFAGNAQLNYKHLCGEYPTASAFALWYAAKIVKTGMAEGGALPNKPKTILIYNHYQHIYHNLLLVSAC